MIEIANPSHIRQSNRVAHARNRIVTFRVSEQELHRLGAASSIEDSRCLSDFVRDASLEAASRALEQPVPVNGGHAPLVRQMSKLEQRVAALEIQLSEMVQPIASMGGGK